MIGILMALFVSFPVFAQTSGNIRFRSDQPDVIVQAAVGPTELGIYFDQLREIIREEKGRDLLAGPIRINPVQFNGGISLEDYMDRKLVRVVQNTLGFSLKQISTSLDVYKMTYRSGVPRLTLISSIEEQDKSLLLTLGIEVRALDVEVENLYLNHHSPGVNVTPQDGNGEIHVNGQENMTLIDDIYLKVVSPGDKPLISIDSPEGLPPVAKGHLTVRVTEGTGGALKLSYVDHEVMFFDGKGAQSLADRIALHIGKESKVGGLDAIEFGKSEFRFLNDPSGILQKKKLLLIDLLAAQGKAALYRDEVGNALREAINGVELAGSRYLRFTRPGPFADLALQSRVNTIGIVDRDGPRPQLHLGTNQSLLWLNNAFLAPDALPFPLSDPSALALGAERITSEIRDGNADVVLGLGQDFLNESIFTATRGRLEFPNDPKTRTDDWIHPGRSGVFIMLDRADQTFGRFVVDLEVKPGFFGTLGLAIATFKKKLYFPLVVIPELKIVKGEDGVPALSLTVRDFDLSDETLRNGIDGVPSNLNRGINRKWLIGKIRKILAPSVGRELKRIPLPALEGIDIERAGSLASDGLGRLVIKMKLGSGEGSFASGLPELFQRFTRK